MITVWPNGVATWQSDDDVYRIAVWESDRPDPEGRDTSDWELLRAGERVYQGAGPDSGVQGFYRGARDALGSLLSFLGAEAERIQYGDGDGDGPIFPDATPELVAFLEMHGDELYDDDDEPYDDGAPCCMAFVTSRGQDHEPGCYGN